MRTGGCYCGAIRYQAGGTPFHATLCHCTDCRRIAGAPMVAWFTVKAADFTLTGTPAEFASSPGVTRSFCPACGTPLTYRSTNHPDDIDIATATLDDPNAVPPADHVYTRSRLAWLRTADGLPEYPTSRSP